MKNPISLAFRLGLVLGSLSLCCAAASVPVINSISPNSAVAGGTGFNLVVTGSNFTAKAYLLWNGSARPTTVVSQTQLMAAISSTEIALAGTVQVSVVNPKPNNQQSNAVTFTIVPPLTITTTSLPGAQVGTSYQTTLAASGGFPPYTWSLASGALPAGLNLSSSTGTISGTPTTAGTFTFSIQVKDSAQPVASTVTASFTMTVAVAPSTTLSFDSYGGLLALPSPTGATGFFRVEKVGNRWTFVTPAGNAFWMFGVYVVDTNGSIDNLGSSYTNRVIIKYGDANVTWGPQMVRRLWSWGFNTIAEYASIWVLPTTTYPTWPGGVQPVKMPFVAFLSPAYYSLLNYANWANGPVKEIVRATDSNYTGYRGHSPDIWDPNFDMWLNNQLTNDQNLKAELGSPWLIGVNCDDADWLQGFGPGPDFPTNPPGHNQPHLGWIILITPPTQTQNTEFGVTYTDTKVYSKYALRNFLSAKYGTIAALNLAWNSSYTTFDSSGGWPTGTGLLDEDGRNPWVGTDYLNLSNTQAQVKADLGAFLLQHAQKYFSIVRARVKQHAPNNLYLGPTTIGGWGTPPRRQILQAAGQYVDVIPTEYNNTQATLDFIAQYAGDLPIVSWEGGMANPDSRMFLYPNAAVAHAFNFQADRASFYATMLSGHFNAAVTSTGSHPLVGIKWWQFTDNWGELSNWGLVSLADNAYNGKEAIIAPGVDLWGYPTGNELLNCGDFLSGVRNANTNLLQALIAARVP